MTNFQFLVFLTDIFRSTKNQLRSQCKLFYSIFSNKYTWHSLKSGYSIIHCNPNDLNVVQIIHRTLNHSTQYKSFNAVQIIQRSTNPSKYYKSFNVVKVIQRCANLSTQYKSFNLVKIIQRCTNHSAGNRAMRYKKDNKIFKWKAI